MATKYRLEQVSLGENWDKFVKESAYGSIFTHTSYLSALKAKAAPYFLYNHQELRAAVLLIESPEDSHKTYLHDYMVYNGVIFGKPAPKQNATQQLSEQFSMQEYIAQELTNQYDTIEMLLHPTIQDMRPFLWHNYHSDLPKYQVDIRYTGYLNIQGFNMKSTLESIPLFSQTSTSRRQEIRYARRKGVVTREYFDASVFAAFYEKTMNRQNIEVRSEALREMENIVESLIQTNQGKIYASYTEHGDLGSMAFWGLEKTKAYYIFGANDPAYRRFHTGTAVLWDSFQFLNEQGVTLVDLEGVNSPKRGWFKLSFGASLVPYYQVTLNS